MIEIIDDGQGRDALLYTDDAQAATRLRKMFKMRGALYSGKERGYSWRVPKRLAVISLKRLGLRFSIIGSVKKQRT